MENILTVNIKVGLFLQFPHDNANKIEKLIRIIGRRELVRYNNKNFIMSCINSQEPGFTFTDK